MTWLIINYFGPDPDFQMWDVHESESKKKKKTSFMTKVLKTVSILSYVPTTLSLCSYFFSKRNLILDRTRRAWVAPRTPSSRTGV